MSATAHETAIEAADLRTSIPRTFAEAEHVLAAALPGYQPRVTQQRLAAAIEDIMATATGEDDRKVLLAEAGTGTGKSLAALIPGIIAAVTQGTRVVVATATKALQTQYATSDLPFLEQYLGIDFEWAVLKGRSNYVCADRVAGLAAPTPGQRKVIDLIDALGPEKVLDRDELPPLSDADWQPLAMPSSECPGAKECPLAKKGMCQPERAKEKAAVADVVVTNLAYLATDLKLRAETGGAVSLLGPVDVLVADEAHNFDQAVTSALSDRLTPGTFNRLANDVQSMFRSLQDECDSAPALGHFAGLLWQGLDTEFAGWQAEQKRQRKDSDQMPMLQRRREALLSAGFGKIKEALENMSRDLKRLEVPTSMSLRKMRLQRRIGSLYGRVTAYLEDDDAETVRWIEEDNPRKGNKRAQLCSVPVLPASFLQRHVWGKMAVILMSATLSAGKDRDGSPDFGYPVRTLGIPQPLVTSISSPSPFDYQSQALLYMPDRNVPLPAGSTKASWQGYAQGAMQNLVTASGGGALLLFTSRSAMESAYRLLAPALQMSGLEVLKQGDATSGELVKKFKADGDAVLFALRTFFEGVDIPGDALRLVIIDKLPFPVPSDLQFAARCDAVNRAAGRDVSFRQLSMPMMTWPLMQASGRLLRNETDRGVIAILDPRLTAKGYGADILRALPPARRTTDTAEAVKFLSRR